MRLALDTNRYRDLVDGLDEAVDILRRADTIVVPFIVLAELRAGFAVGNRGRENEAVLQRFLSKPGVEIAFATDGTTRAYAQLFRQLRAQGTPIPTNDLWIAAVVVDRSLALYTRDAHFRHLAQLDVV